VAKTMKISVLWDVAPCCLVDIDRRFRGAYCLHYKGEAVSSSETSVSIYQITRRNIPEDSHVRPEELFEYNSGFVVIVLSTQRPEVLDNQIGSVSCEHFLYFT
jgi:hypothetical protein